MTAERAGGADDRAEVARVGDAVERDEQRRLALVDHLLEQVLRVRVLVRRHLERDALVHAVEAGHAVELGTRDLHDRDLAVRGDRQHLLDAVVHLDALRDVERGRGDLGAQRLEHRVAAGDHLGVVVLLGRARRATAPEPGGLALAAGGGVALGGGLALAGGVPGAVLGLGRRPAALEGALVLAAGALGGALLALAGAGAPRLAAVSSPSCRRSLRRCVQCVPSAVSSSAMPAAAMASRMRSAAAQSLAARASARCVIMVWTRASSAAASARSASVVPAPGRAGRCRARRS